jgi:hypothetical protein
MKAFRIVIAVTWLLLIFCHAYKKEDQKPFDAGYFAEMEEQKKTATGFENWADRAERIRFVKVSLAFLGTPYIYGGNTAAGMDCSGFVYRMYRTFDITLPRNTKKQFKAGRPVERNDLEEGDLVFFNGDQKPLHVGIYLGDGKFIHAPSTGGSIRIDFLDTPYRFKHFIGGVRIRELKASGREKR